MTTVALRLADRVPAALEALLAAHEQAEIDRVLVEAYRKHP